MQTGVLGLMVALSSALLAQAIQPVRVPDEATAISIARPALVKIYGKSRIQQEEPLRAVLEANVWHVYGSLCCPDSKGVRTCEPGRCVGGVAEAQIRRDDGNILKILHTR